MLAPWKESYDKLRLSIEKLRHHFTNKDAYSQSCGFPIVMYRCESWAIRKAQCRRTDAFKLCWERLLRVPWTARRSNQLILKEINPEYSLERCCWSSNTSAIWFEELTHWKRPWCWKRLRAEGEGGSRGLYHRLNGHESEQTPGVSGGQRSLESMRS